MSELRVSGRLWVQPDEGEFAVVDAVDMDWKFVSPAIYSDSFLAGTKISDLARKLATCFFDDWCIEWELGASATGIHNLVGMSCTGCQVTGFTIVFRKDEE